MHVDHIFPRLSPATGRIRNVLFKKKVRMSCDCVLPEAET